MQFCYSTVGARSLFLNPPNPRVSLFLVSLGMEEENRGVVRRDVGPTPFLPSSSSSSMSFLSRRILREPSVPERESTSQEAEERPIGWGYSRPVVILDVVWNMAFVAVSVVVVGSTLWERPSRPLRAWLTGYSFQCVLHVVFVVAEYRRRIRAGRMEEEELLLENGRWNFCPVVSLSLEGASAEASGGNLFQFLDSNSTGVICDVERNLFPFFLFCFSDDLHCNGGE